MSPQPWSLGVALGLWGASGVLVGSQAPRLTVAYSRAVSVGCLSRYGATGFPAQVEKGLGKLGKRCEAGE